MVSSIKKGALIGYLTIFINIVTGLLYTPWMIHQIGVSDYGLYILISSFISYFLLDFGLGTAVSRYVSKYREEGKFEEIGRVLSIIIKVFTIIDFVIFALLFVCFFYISEIFTGLTPDEIEKFKVIYCIAGFFSLLTFPFSYLNGILIAFEKFVTLKGCDLVHRILVVTLVVLCLIKGWGLYALVVVNSGITFLIVLYKIAYIAKTKHISIDLKYFDKGLLIQLLKFSSWVFVIGVSSRLMYNIIPTILGRYCNSTEVAKFSIAMMIEGYVYTFASALNGLFLPRVMRIAVNGNNGSELTKLMIKVGRLQLLVVGAIITGFVVIGKNFVSLWLGKDFEMSYWVTLCLITPGIISLIEEIGNTALIAANELKYRAFLFIGASIISIVGGYFLTPSLGAIGAGISVSISLVFCHIIGMNILYKKKLDIDIMMFFKESIFRFIPVMIVIFVVMFIVKHFITFTGWIGFIVEATFFGLIFVLSLWLLYMNEEEKAMIIQTFKKQL